MRSRVLGRRSTIVTAALACGLAAALVAPSAAPAASVKYSGPVAGPGNEGASIQMRVLTVNKGERKGKPKTVWPFKVVGELFVTCTDGVAGVIGNSHTESEIGHDIGVGKKGRFSAVDPPPWNPDPEAGYRFEVEGTVTKRRASGTFSLSIDYPSKTCSTGTVSWSATPGGQR